MTAKEKERKEYQDRLREILEPGDMVFTILRHVSASGMSRNLDLVVIKDNEPMRLTYWVAKAAGFTYNEKKEALVVGGCGMDMGFHVVYNLSRYLWPEGFGVEGTLVKHWEVEGIPCKQDHSVRPTSKEHAADLVEAGATFYGRNGDKSGWDNDGGYALKQGWL
jgi:hypothetical protein